MMVKWNWQLVSVCKSYIILHTDTDTIILTCKESNKLTNFDENDKGKEGKP